MLHQLRYFVVTAEEENLHRASARLNITQSALSRRIQQLENYLSVPLFTRVTRGVKLTEPGKALLNDARLILDQIKLAEHHVKQVARGREGRLRIGISTSAHIPILVETLKALKSSFPDLELVIARKNSEALFRDIAEDQLDIVFAYNAPGRLLEFEVGAQRLSLQTHKLFTDRFVLAMSQHRRDSLGGRGKDVTLADLKSQTLFVSLNHLDHCVFGDLVSRWRAAGLGTAVISEGMSAESTVDLVVADLGVAFVLEKACTFVRRDAAVVEFGDANYSVDMIAAWSPTSSSTALSNFLEIVRDESKFQVLPDQTSGSFR